MMGFKGSETERVEPRPSAETWNKILLALAGTLGGIIATIIIFADRASGAKSSILFNTQIWPREYAIALLVAWLLIVPIAIAWHRTVDEHEREAYRYAGYLSGYIYLVGAPTWWLAWRAGWTATPNGVALYLALVFAWCAIWLFKKYR